MEISEIRPFLQSLLAIRGDVRPFTQGEGLFSGGRLNSIDATEVVFFLEDNFGVDFGGDFDRDQIDSVDAIYRLIAKNKTAS